MASATVSLVVENGQKKASITQTPDPARLIQGNDVTIDVGSGYNGTGIITSVEFFENDATQNNKKGASLGTWIRSSPRTQPIGNKLKVATVETQNIKITDEETFSGTATEEWFHYGVTVTDSDGPYTADPVIINRKSLGG